MTDRTARVLIATGTVVLIAAFLLLAGFGVGTPEILLVLAAAGVGVYLSARVGGPARRPPR